jgi:MFS family permease
MFDTYRAAFTAPGSVAFSAAGLVMRLPAAVYPLALVLLVSAQSGHYSFAGVLAGVYVVANGIGNPVLARFVDRLGQGRMLVPASAVHLAAVVVLGALAQAGAPDWTLVTPAAVAGFTYLPVGSLVRARWSYVLAGRPELSTAYSLESAFDELIFTLGPLIATVCATLVHPLLGLGVGAGLTGIGAVLLRAERDTEPPVHHSTEKHPSPMRSRGMVLLCLAAFGMGAMFSSAEVTMVAFADQHGHKALGGVALAALACGSAISGFSYGARHWAAPVLDRFRMQALVFAVLPALFLAASNVPVLLVCALVVGLTIAPTLITAFGLIERVVPPSALTEGLSWLVTGLSVGWGAGSSVVGGIADAHGARWAFLVPVAAGLFVGALGLLVHRRLSVTAGADGAPQPVVVG